MGPKEDGSRCSRGAGADSSEENGLGLDIHLRGGVTMIISVDSFTMLNI